MMKTISWTFLIGFLFFVSCKNEANKDAVNSKEGFAIYSSDSLGFSLEYPKDFAPKENIRKEIPIAFYEVNDDTSSYLFHPNMLIRMRSIPPVEISASQYLQATQTEIKLNIQSKVPDFKTYDADSTVVDGLLIGSFKYDIPFNDTTSFKCKMYVALLKDRAIEFNCTTVLEDFDQYESTFDNMIQSLQFKKK